MKSTEQLTADTIRIVEWLRRDTSLDSFVRRNWLTRAMTIWIGLIGCTPAEVHREAIELQIEMQQHFHPDPERCAGQPPAQ